MHLARARRRLHSRPFGAQREEPSAAGAGAAAAAASAWMLHKILLSESTGLWACCDGCSVSAAAAAAATASALRTRDAGTLNTKAKKRI